MTTPAAPSPVPAPAPAGRWSLFGKLPCAGDFLRRGVDADVVARLDAWLSAELGRRAALDPDGWEAAAEAAPAWRFRLSPGVLAPEAAAGVFSPGRDRAGRVFPVLAFAGEDADTEAAAGLLAEALDTAASADDLLARLDRSTPAPAPEAPPPGFGLWTRHSDGMERLLEGLPAGEAFDALLQPAAAGGDGMDGAPTWTSA